MCASIRLAPCRSGGQAHADHELRALSRLPSLINGSPWVCLLYTSDPADERLWVDPGGRRCFKTKNKIHKAAAWIAEGFIRKELTKMMTFPLEEKLDEIQNDINTQLKDINQEYNMDLKADLYSITSEHFEMKPGAIETTIKASLKIEAYIKDLRKLGAPIQKK